MSLTRVLLASGRSIALSEVRVSSTYGGMLEGYPCRLVNDLKIGGLLRTAGAGVRDGRVHLVVPTRDRPEGRGGGFGPVEVLPPVTCVGAFASAAVDPGLEPVLHRSALTVVWFQHTTDVAEAGEVPGFLDIPWEEVAEDHEL
ncbi:hypothetical protein OG786_23780 [Streptomyces sp. NBC_00101]|uniref:hypothetical protein n=1 Tax=Streptomyces sp. NBC_00101 TaxID=2975651 RepID=UPI0032444820